MARKAKHAKAANTSQGQDESERRYRSTAEIRRDFFPNAPASLFEMGYGESQEDLIVRHDGETIRRH